MSYYSRRSRSRSRGRDRDRDRDRYSRRSRSRSRDRGRYRSRSRSRDRDRHRYRRSRSRDRGPRREPRGRPPMDESVRATATNLFVGNLSFSVDDHRLREIFQPYGELTRAVVGVDKFTGRSKGFGFVAFQTHEQAESALNALTGQDIDGRALRLDFDPGLDARGERAVSAAAAASAPYEKRRSPSPVRRRPSRSPSPRRRSPTP